MKYKRCQSLLIVCLLVYCGFCFSSCREDPATTRLLQEAEAALDSVPQKAYTLLKNADSIAVFSTAQRAEWNLLITQAMDKIKEKPANDSIIRQAVDYYAQKEDPHRQMLSYYYWGRVTHTLDDALRAQEYYLKAREKAIQIHNAPYLARINSNIGMLYLYQELPEEALPYLLETQEYFVRQNDPVNQRLANRNLARAYSILHEPDSTLFYYKKALIYATVSKQRVALINEIIPIYINQAQYDSAFVYMQEIQKLSEYRLSLQSSLVVGQYFAHTNQPDSANYYLKKCLDTDKIHIHATACFHLYQMARERQDLKNYTLHQTQYEILRDSIMDNTYTEKLLYLQTLYDHEKKENEIKQIKQAHTIAKLVGGLLACTVFVLGMFLFLLLSRIQRRKKEWENQQTLWAEKEKEQENKIQESIKQLNQNNQVIEILEKRLDNKEENEEALQELLVDLKEENKLLKYKTTPINAIDKRLASSPVYQKFRDAERAMSLHEIDEFLHLIDQVYPSFKSKIYEFNTPLSKDEWAICYLTKGRLINSTIAILLKQSESNIGNKKRKLCAPFFSIEKGSVTIFDKQIRELE
ncbi:tetratricopeptide repeat protein [Parabacteroides sp. PF5-6]|uniref:tetratricopeptide repeat protein n=1 Tax=Parabacteroides sp. PF5-6 TaxID=1742403 RepID=UPI002406BE74|nr:tetratricopeptide repeat protein [Parabacteroides sp. PF5-6]MDF9830398.1 hypothetical protein [Parabacteroides sp. PF5-6]